MRNNKALLDVNIVGIVVEKMTTNYGESSGSDCGLRHEEI